MKKMEYIEEWRKENRMKTDRSHTKCHSAMNTPMNASRCVVVVKEPYIDALVFVRFGGEDGI